MMGLAGQVKQQNLSSLYLFPLAAQFGGRPEPITVWKSETLAYRISQDPECISVKTTDSLLSYCFTDNSYRSGRT